MNELQTLAICFGLFVIIIIFIRYYVKKKDKWKKKLGFEKEVEDNAGE